MAYTFSFDTLAWLPWFGFRSLLVLRLNFIFSHGVWTMRGIFNGKILKTRKVTLRCIDVHIVDVRAGIEWQIKFLLMEIHFLWNSNCQLYREILRFSWFFTGDKSIFSLLRVKEKKRKEKWILTQYLKHDMDGIWKIQFNSTMIVSWRMNEECELLHSQLSISGGNIFPGRRQI